MKSFSKTALSLAFSGFIYVIAPSSANAFVCANCGTEWTQLLNNGQLVQQVETSLNQLQTQLNSYQNLVNNTKNIPDQLWGNAFSDISQVSSLIRQSKALAAQATNLDSEFSSRYGSYENYLNGSLSGDTWSNKYSQWSNETNDNLKYALKSTGLQLDQMDDEDSTIKSLQAMSESSTGRMQAIQVGNQMAAQGIRQTQKLRQMMGMQIQMQADYMATQADQTAAQRADVANFNKQVTIPTTDGTNY
ncbi:P-type conjugative transfer protein TrbJ [Erwinia amylovora]|uniref:P-type conjugative transfer protein TrbJ n=1 Tax=Erwinia amylovora TaxID=552 RepID=UPI001443A339|nr:P-type conjugative transfer protein TrbJ [Erwinia amylovora]